METRTIQLTVPASFEELCRKWAEHEGVSCGDIMRSILNRGLDVLIEENKQSPRFQLLAAIAVNDLADSVPDAEGVTRVPR